MNALVKLQKRAIRIISGVRPRTHTDPLFTKLKLLKCDEINKYLVGRLMYRIYNEERTLFDTVRGIMIMYLALNQNLAKSICDTMVLLFGTVYYLVGSLLMSVKHFFQTIEMCYN